MTYNKKYSNGEIMVLWQPDKCMHAAVCLYELPKVFDNSRHPWVDLAQADTAQILATIGRCPSNALTYSWCDEAKNAADSHPKNRRNVTSPPPLATPNSTNLT